MPKYWIVPRLWLPIAKSWLIGKDPDAGKDLKAGGEGENRGWDGWMASPTQWTWVWASSGRRWRTGKPGMLQSTKSQRVRHDWEMNNNYVPRTVLTLLLLLLSHFSRVRLCATPETASYQAPLSLGFSRQEHWSGLPFPSPMHESESESEVAQSCQTLNDLMHCSLPGSSVHGIFQARVLEWGAIAFSGSNTRVWGIIRTHKKLWKTLSTPRIMSHIISPPKQS